MRKNPWYLILLVLFGLVMCWTRSTPAQGGRWDMQEDPIGETTVMVQIIDETGVRHCYVGMVGTTRPHSMRVVGGMIQTACPRFVR